MLSIRYRLVPELSEDVSLDAGIGNFGEYASIIQNIDTFRSVGERKDGRVALALEGDGLIVGYVTCGRPDLAERWSKLGGLMYEMEAIEVSRNFRRQGIGRRMIETVLCDDFFEDKIAYISSFCWHWDLQGSGLTSEAYRNMMVRLMESHGFREYYSNEPNLAIKKENIFMARIGSRVSANDRKRFRNLRFGITVK